MLRALVVDDEKPARDDLHWLLDRHDNIATVDEACGATEALKLLTTADDDTFDVVFLDIRMPGMDGLDLARTIGRFESPPSIVFVTAFDTPASDAFELDAVDYLRKPVADDRLSRAIERVCTIRSVAARESDLQPGRLAVSVHGGRRVLLRPTEVTHFEASGDYVRVHTVKESFLIRETMGRLTESWSRYGFLRIHRGYSVRMSAVDEVRSSSTGRYVLVNDLEIPVSRRYTKGLTQRLTGEQG